MVIVMAKLNMAYLSSFKKPSKTAVVLIAGVTVSGTPCPWHFIVPFGAEAPSGHVAQAWAIPPPSWGLLSQWHRQQTTTPFCQVLKNRAKLLLSSLSSFKKPSKTAVVLIAGVTFSGSPCPRHFIVPFGAEAPSGHVAQAWAIPPSSWGLLSQWHRQQTTTPETNGASPARTQRHSQEISRFIWR